MPLRLKITTRSQRPRRTTILTRLRHWQAMNRSSTTSNNKARLQRWKITALSSNWFTTMGTTVGSISLHLVIAFARPSRRRLLTGNVVLSLNELFHAQPFKSNVGAQTETDEGK